MLEKDLLMFDILYFECNDIERLWMGIRFEIISGIGHCLYSKSMKIKKY